MKRRFRDSEFTPAKGKEVGTHREQIAADIASKYGFPGDLVSLFAEHEGDVVHKWHHYIPLYERYLSRWRNRSVRFLEIGVSKGGSMEMWRNYFGSHATIYGIDIDESCARYDNKAGQVRIGSQDDPNFLSDVVEEMGGLDVVLDDGSHVMEHVSASLRELFPRLSMGGVYIVEDLHTAYWEKYGGGLKAPLNFFNLVRSMIDDMHAWYHEAGIANSETGASVTGIHIHDSFVVFDKGPVHPPVYSRVGRRTK